MGLRHPRGESVTVHPYEADGSDPYGNPLEGFGEDIELVGVAVAPRQQEEVSDTNRRMVAYGFDLYAEFDAPVGPHDEVTVRDVRCEVDGEIERWRNPFTGKKPGCLIRVKRVEG